MEPGTENSPVQPLDSAGSDSRISNLLGRAKAEVASPVNETGEFEKVPASLCPNCLNGRGQESELDEGKCAVCGFDAAERVL